MKMLDKPLKPVMCSISLAVLLAGTATSGYANTPKKHHTKHHTQASSSIVQKTIINNYGLINNGLVQKTQQSSTAISNTQDNSLHQDSSTHQTLTQVQNNTLNQTQVNTQVNALNQTQVNGSSSTTATTANNSAQTFSALKWSTDNGKQYLDITGSDIHVKPRLDGTGPHTVTATSKTGATDAQRWQISFDIRFGSLRDQASSFHFKYADRDICSIAADGFSNKIGVFVGSSEIYDFPADNQWHHFSILNEGSSLTIGLDGKQVGTGTSQSSPDNVALENNQDMTMACHQEGVWVRNVQVTTGN